MLLLAIVLGGVAGLAAERPNIVYILADDMGVGDVSALNPGCRWKTPNIDRLAAEGRVFTDAHSACGVCTPSRYALLTGRYPWRGRMKSGVLHGYDGPLIEPGRLTVAGLLKTNGYATAAVGKWHLGFDWAKAGEKPEAVDYAQPIRNGPTTRGFDHFYGISASLDMPPYVYVENDRATALPSGTVTNSPAPRMWRAGPIARDFRFEEVQPRFVAQARSFIESKARSKTPFFLYLALAAPHTPVVPTRAYEGRTGTTSYGDFVVQVDAGVGEILDSLERSGVARETLVIFTSDNGFAPAANLKALRDLGHDPCAGLRGHKADLFEGGHRIPFIARWPGRVPAGTRCGQTVGQLDLMATCAEILGVRLPPEAGEDSVSLLGLLKGGEEAPPGRAGLVHQSSNGSLALRQGRWKLLLTPDSGGWSFPQPGSRESRELPRYQLYDLGSDLAETKNLLATEPERVARMGAVLRGIIEDGRSTPGPRQPVDEGVAWPQVKWRSEFGGAVANPDGGKAGR